MRDQAPEACVGILAARGVLTGTRSSWFPPRSSRRVLPQGTARSANGLGDVTEVQFRVEAVPYWRGWRATPAPGFRIAADIADPAISGTCPMGDPRRVTTAKTGVRILTMPHSERSLEKHVLVRLQPWVRGVFRSAILPGVRQTADRSDGAESCRLFHRAFPERPSVTAIPSSRFHCRGSFHERILSCFIRRVGRPQALSGGGPTSMVIASAGERRTVLVGTCWPGSQESPGHHLDPVRIPFGGWHSPC